MTAPMTPRDPFTDEDVRKAVDTWCTHDGTNRESLHAALLAGTERLRAQGTWNDAIEAAAKWHDQEAETCLAEQRRNPGNHDFWAERYRWHKDAAQAIRALKRPEAP